MKRVTFASVLILCTQILHAAGTFDPVTQCKSISPETCTIAQELGRGVNMGNMLEAPREGDWGLRVEQRFIDKSTAVFKTVRIPVRWSNHAAKTADAKLDETFAARVDTVVDAFLAKGVYVILDLHHYSQIYGDALQPNEFSVDPAVLDARLIAIWKQVAERYKNRSPKLIFELLNEPHGKMSGETWNLMIPKLLAVVRPSNPTRAVIVGPGYWNQTRALPQFRLPPDRNLIVTLHSYDPHNFTHQGISWMPQYPAGVTCCDGAQRKLITDTMNAAAQWSVTNGYPIFIGEFGAFQKADMASRETYTRFARDEFEKRGFGWTYWEFASSFGMFDPKTNTWREPLRRALLD
jgi:endoglucanase